MSSDLLPESVNLFLDDYETSLCLPILVVMVLCTAQFVFNHIFDIGYVIYQNVKKPETEEDAQEDKKADMMKKLKGMLTALGIGKPETATPTKSPPVPIDIEDEEWEYCDGIAE